MTVYVDDARHPYERMIMCHMLADTPAELLTMAKAIGVQAKWVQKAGTPYEHFDICQSKRAKALTLGAQAVTRKELGVILKSKK